MIAIIAILAGMLLPALGKARERARTASCLSNLKQHALTDQMYAQDYDQWVVQFLGGWGAIHGKSYWSGAYMKTGYYPENSNPAMFKCPSLTSQTAEAYEKWPTMIYGVETNGVNFNWSPNAYFTCANNGGAGTDNRLITLKRVGKPSNAFHHIDSLASSLVDQAGMIGINPATNSKPHARHGGRINANYLDGHAETKTPKQWADATVNSWCYGNDTRGADWNLGYYDETKTAKTVTGTWEDDKQD